MATSIYSMIYNELDAKRKHTPAEFKKWRKLFDALDREAWTDIILDGSTWWTESYQYSDATDAELDDLLAYLKLKNYKWLYEGGK